MSGKVKLSDVSAAWEADKAAGCTCGILRAPDYKAIRQRRGSETHSPYCPIGKAERKRAS